MPPIQRLSSGLNVAPLVYQLARHPELWNQHTGRTEAYASPHKGVDDIWARYNDPENLGRPDFHGPHESVWYPCIRVIPGAWKLAREVMRRVGGKTLGGVLITRIHPGGMVRPHVDTGWHAGHYEKFAVQIKGNQAQAFCFEGCELRPEPGDLYTFDNSKLHWVINDSDHERITLIVCIKR